MSFFNFDKLKIYYNLDQNNKIRIVFYKCLLICQKSKHLLEERKINF